MLKVANSVINASQIAGTLPVANGGTGLTSYTANGVVYASGSTTLASGSALTFDGTNFSATGTTTVNSANSTAVALVVKGETGNGIRQRFIGQAASGQYNWQIGASITAAGNFSIIPSTAVDGTTFNTAVGTFTTAGLEVTGTLSSTGVVTFSAYGAGAATFSAAGVISSVSDETWKRKDGVPTDPDAMLKKLEPGYWYYNDEKKETFGADRQLGFYAQNVNAAIGPEAAPEPEEGKPWGYYDRSVLAVTVMSLQKALATIEKQQALIESLSARLTALESK